MIQFNCMKIKWEHTEKVLRIIEVLVIILGVWFAGVQIRDVRNMQSAQLMIDFNNQLNSPVNSKIVTTIENKGILLKENSGNITDTEIDKYLGLYELLYDVWDTGLITDNMLYSGFSYDILVTYHNPEIINYLKKIRVDDKEIFAGFEALAKSLELSN